MSEIINNENQNSIENSNQDRVDMSQIIKSTFGESSNEIRATFKKTVLVRQYETEVVELESTVKFDKPITGPERVFVSAILQAQLEYDAYCQLYFKGIILQPELKKRRECLEEDVAYIKKIAESCLGKPLDNYLGVNAN